MLHADHGQFESVGMVIAVSSAEKGLVTGGI